MKKEHKINYYVDSKVIKCVRLWFYIQQCKSKGGLRVVNNSQDTKSDSISKLKNKYSPVKNKETPLKKLNVKLESRILKTSIFINNEDDKSDCVLKHYINFVSTSSL
jgi:hypothetical protein